MPEDRVWLRRHQRRSWPESLGERFTEQSDLDVLVEFEPGRTPALLGLAAMELERDGHRGPPGSCGPPAGSRRLIGRGLGIRMRSFGDGLQGRAQAALVAPAIPDHCGCEDVRYGVADPSRWYDLIGDRVARTAEVTWPEILGDARNDRSRWCDGVEGAPRRWVPEGGSGHGHKVSSKASHAEVVERSDSLLCLWLETERLNLVTVVDNELPTDRWRGNEGFGARSGDHTSSVARRL